MQFKGGDFEQDPSSDVEESEDEHIEKDGGHWVIWFFELAEGSFLMNFLITNDVADWWKLSNQGFLDYI